MEDRIKKLIIDGVGVSVIRSRRSPVNLNVIWIDTSETPEVPKIFANGLWRVLAVKEPSILPDDTDVSTLVPDDDSHPSDALILRIFNEILVPTGNFADLNGYKDRLDVLIRETLEAIPFGTLNTTAKTVEINDDNISNILDGAFGGRHVSETDLIPVSKINPLAVWSVTNDSGNFNRLENKLIVSNTDRNGFIRQVINVFFKTGSAETGAVDRNGVNGTYYSAIREALGLYIREGVLSVDNFTDGVLSVSNRMLWTPILRGVLTFDDLSLESIKKRHISVVHESNDGIPEAIADYSAATVGAFYGSIRNFYNTVGREPGVSAGRLAAWRRIITLGVTSDQLVDGLFNESGHTNFFNGAFRGIRILDSSYSSKIPDRSLENTRINSVERASDFTRDVVPISYQGYLASANTLEVKFLLVNPLTPMVTGIEFYARMEIAWQENTTRIQHTVFISRGYTTGGVEFFDSSTSRQFGTESGNTRLGEFGSGLKSRVRWSVTVIKATPRWNSRRPFRIANSTSS